MYISVPFLFLVLYFVPGWFLKFLCSIFSQVWVWNPREERWVVSDHTDPERMDNWVNFVLRYIQHKVNRWRMFVDRARIQDRPFLYLSR